jgi:dTDP-4-amino-4,6-dideoxygalactose transaminase
MHAQPSFARFGYRAGDLPNSWRAQRQSLTLPLPPAMPEGEVDRVVQALRCHVDAAARTAPHG